MAQNLKLDLSMGNEALAIELHLFSNHFGTIAKTSAQLSPLIS